MLGFLIAITLALLLTVVLPLVALSRAAAARDAYFQSQLSHVGYVAAPSPVWPESPAAEALGRLG